MFKYNKLTSVLMLQHIMS